MIWDIFWLLKSPFSSLLYVLGTVWLSLFSRHRTGTSSEYDGNTSCAPHQHHNVLPLQAHTRLRGFHQMLLEFVIFIFKTILKLSTMKSEFLDGNFLAFQFLKAIV